MVTAFAFFLLGGALALIMRAELAAPELQVVTPGRYNELFTMHGSIMMFLFLGPFAFGLANYLVPLQIGAQDMSFPRLNALSYWLYLGGGLTMISGFLTADGAADFGWFAYAPLSLKTYAPSVGGDLWIIGLLLTGFSGVFTGINVITTVLTMRAPGMSMFRLPIFCWNMVVTSVLVLMAFPVLTAASVMLFADRHFGAHIFDPAAGGSPILWQHLFWFFGHPEVYILALPFFGVITEVLPVFSWRPVFGYKGLVFATLAIAALSMGVWAHHMFATGAVLLPFFSGLSFLIAVPTGVKFFNWIGTLWGGRITFQTPMLFAIGFLLTFLLGGITGVLLASPPIDFHMTDSYFVVAHMHYVLFGGSVFALYAGIYYWFPKFTGKKLGEGLGRLHFATNFVGFHLTFFVQHQLGLQGMPRRVADYGAADGFTTLNQISTVGSFLLGISTVVFLVNVGLSLRRGPAAGDDPWLGHTLEWATSSPPPPLNFERPLPPIRSNRPLFDARHPDVQPAEHGREPSEGTAVS
ncbi:MAG: cytochrome c oxidase subunit I [Actinobacteria bacterium]|nr:cytochrome c oxidase subunit I [Actinomycetota bacterium]MBW3649326.1 cytochrome c oxidase subunit I [Actinomycetota bacterium]